MSITRHFSATTAFALIMHVGVDSASGLKAKNQYGGSSTSDGDAYALLQRDAYLPQSDVVLLESIVWNATSDDVIEMDANSTTIRTADDDESADGDYQRRCIVGSILTVFAAFTVFGNTLVMTAVVREPCLRATVTNYFVVSLAVADLVIGAVVMPFSIVVEVTDGWWPFGADWCDVWHSFDVLASTASILNLSVIALDRYWAITDPIAYPSRMSTARAFVFIGLVWVCSAAISFPAIAWWRHSAAVSVDAAATDMPTLSVTQSTDFEVIDEFELADDQTTTSTDVIVLVAALETCHFTDDSWYLIFSSLISFYGPVSIILYAYYRIYSAAAAQLRSLERGSKVLTTSDGVSASNGESGVMTLRIHRGGGSGYHTASLSAGARTNASMPRNQSIAVGENTNGSGGSFTSPRRSPDRRPISADARLLHSTAPAASNATSTNGFRRFSSRLPNNSSTSSTLRRRWNTLTVCRRRLGRVARERKAAKTLGIVMGVFCACWVPFFVTNLLYGVCRHVGCVHNPETLFSVFTWLGYVNSGMNPVIYACSMRDFRRAFIRLLCRKRCRRPSPSSSLVTAGYGSGRAVALYRRSTGSVTVGHQLQRRSMQAGGTGRAATDSEYSSTSFIYAEFPS